MSEETPKVEQEKTVMDDKRKNALLRYVAIMFAVAFVFVLFSMITQMRDNRHQISQLNQSSTSALQKAEQLQDTNRVLEENNEFLKKEIAELNLRIDELEQQLADSDAEHQELAEEEAAHKEQLASENEKIQHAYELLIQLKAQKTEEILKELETYKAYLGPKGLETYESILMEEGEENND